MQKKQEVEAEMWKKMDQKWSSRSFFISVSRCWCVCCCHRSVEPVGGAAERHEGWRDPTTGHAVPSPAHRRPPANVGEEHPQPAGQQGHRDAHTPGQQPAYFKTHALKHTHTHTKEKRHVHRLKPAQAACGKVTYKTANENAEPIIFSPICCCFFSPPLLRQHIFLPAYIT